MEWNETAIRKIYAGWLGKTIGIRLGAPMEGWTYQKIKETLGEISGYTKAYRNFAADDDSNGPIFFVRALEEGKAPFGAAAVAEALLNYAPYEHGFFWWGGYGVSTEHTAYLNLRAGIPAPQSGSIRHNGTTVAEQIGGQIFIDSFGLVAPGNPALAADMAQQSASVTHDGNGIYGARFVAACISLAFCCGSVQEMIQGALKQIPRDCQYAQAVRAVMEFYRNDEPKDWERAFQFVHDHYGYDRYAGACHIIPNICVMILALLYGEGEFTKTLCICCMCGWDTDCNVGQVGTMLGVLGGVEGIDSETWIRPLNDLLICSGVMGTLNIQDIPFGAEYMARLAFRLAGKEAPAPWAELLQSPGSRCHFEYPGSTNALRARGEAGETASYTLENTGEAAHTGRRSLKLTAEHAATAYLYRKTYYHPEDFEDSRYDPSFSPLIYPGQTLRGFLMTRQRGTFAAAYARDAHTGQNHFGEWIALKPGEWTCVRAAVSAPRDALLEEAGFACRFGDAQGQDPRVVYLDDISIEGSADYTLAFRNEKREVWNFLHSEISQMTRFKGHAFLEHGSLHLACADDAEVYTGHHGWTDYTVSYTLCPVAGEKHYGLARVQGAVRCYAVGFDGAGSLAILKNENGYRRLASTAFDWQYGQWYTIEIRIRGGEIHAVCGNAVLHAVDDADPYERGSVGVSVHQGSHCVVREIRVSP